MIKNGQYFRFLSHSKMLHCHIVSLVDARWHPLILGFEFELFILFTMAANTDHPLLVQSELQKKVEIFELLSNTMFNLCTYMENNMTKY